MKEYRENNKEKIQEYKKEYYETNKDNFKEYQETNKEKINGKNKEYYETNKTTILEKNKIKNKCECGCEVNKKDLTRHKKNKKTY